MALDAGDPQATSGMAKAIFEALKAQLLPPLQDANVKDESLAKIEDGWKSLSFAVASGVVAELTQGPQDPFFAWLAGFAAAVQSGQVGDFLKTHKVPTNLRGIQ
jgi:hypothetical protein